MNESTVHRRISQPPLSNPESAVVPSATVDSMLARARSRLSPSPSASLDSQLLLAHVLGKDRPWVFAHGDSVLDSDAIARYENLIEQRRRGVPVAHLRGFVNWLDMQLAVSPDTLIPRPETELLFERTVEIARTMSVTSVADLGTGSGAVAIALARALPGVRVLGIDVSVKALAIARLNVERYGMNNRVELLHGDLLEPLVAPPGLIVANLPYLSDELMATLPDDVRHEPALALRGGVDGMDVYCRLFDALHERGWRIPLLLEIDDSQAEGMVELVREKVGAQASIRRDYAGLRRMIEVQGP